jgi:hypothetical protein
MKKTYFKKALGIVLLLVVMFTALSSTVSARYKYIDIIGASLSINSSGLASCGGYVMPSDSNTNSTVTVELQRKSGNSWTSEYSWSGSSTGTWTAAASGTRYVVRGTYRVVTTAKVYSSSGSLLETQSVTSSEVTY